MRITEEDALQVGLEQKAKEFAEKGSDLYAEELRRRKAQKLYDDGTELYKQGDYEGAAEKFAAAHDLNPSNEEISRKLSAATHLRQIEIQTENEREAFKQRAGEIREEMRKRLEEFKEIARDETKEELAKKGDKALKDILDRICGDLCAEATMDIRDIQKQASRNVEDVLNALPQAVGQMGSGSTDDSAIQRVVDIANEDANKIKEKDVSIWVKWLKKLGFREKEK